MANKTVQLAVNPRNERGSRANKRLRDTGQVPGVVYGHKQEVLSVALNKRELSQHLDKGTHVFELKLDGKDQTVLIKEVQYDHLGSEVIHVDFARVDKDERVQVTVPLELKGTPKGEADGGVLTQVIAALQIECAVLEIPDVIRHNISEMKLDDVLHIKDITLPAGVKCLQDGELIVATVKEMKEEVAAPAAEEAGAAEPEVIGRKAGEEEEAAEGEEKKK